MVFNGSKGIFNGLVRFERRKDIHLFKNMGNLICGPLDIHEMNLSDRINTDGLYSRNFAGSVKGLEALGFGIPIISKDFKKMRFLFIEVDTIRDSKSVGSKSVENSKFLSREVMRTGM